MGDGARHLSTRWRRVRGRLGGLVPAALAVGVLALVPFNTCLVRRVVGIPCGGCGFTRASLRLVAGDVAGSLRLHPLALPGAVLGLCALLLALGLPEHHPAWPRFARWALRVSAAGLVVVWVLRIGRVLPHV